MDRFRYDSLTRLADYVLDYENSYYENMGITIPHNKVPGKIDEIEEYESIFVKIDLLPYYSDFLSKLDIPFHLFTGRGAKSPEKNTIEKIISNKNLLSWAAPNIELLDERIMQVPIGFCEEGPNRPSGSFPLPELKEKTNNIVVTYMGDTHESRNNIPKNLDILFIDKRENYSEYLEHLNISKYSICPRGFGVDTHRVIESIAMNSIPIVLTSILDPLYNKMNCIIVDNWEDIKKELPEKTLNREQITFEYWKDKILEHQQLFETRKT